MPRAASSWLSREAHDLVASSNILNEARTPALNKISSATAHVQSWTLADRPYSDVDSILPETLVSSLAAATHESMITVILALLTSFRASVGTNGIFRVAHGFRLLEQPPGFQKQATRCPCDVPQLPTVVARKFASIRSPRAPPAGGSVRASRVRAGKEERRAAKHWR